MSMEFSFKLNPFGAAGKSVEFATMYIWTYKDTHMYRLLWDIEDPGYPGRPARYEVSGHVPKERSGHRNFLHMLQKIIEDIFDKNDLEKDYVHALYQIQEALGDPEAKAASYE